MRSIGVLSFKNGGPKAAYATFSHKGRRNKVRGETALHHVYPRRITIADPVPGMAQPRLADSSAFLTCRQPPSR